VGGGTDVAVSLDPFAHDEAAGADAAMDVMATLFVCFILVFALSVLVNGFTVIDPARGYVHITARITGLDSASEAKLQGGVQMNLRIRKVKSHDEPEKNWLLGSQDVDVLCDTFGIDSNQDCRAKAKSGVNDSAFAISQLVAGGREFHWQVLRPKGGAYEVVLVEGRGFSKLRESGRRLRVCLEATYPGMTEGGIHARCNEFATKDRPTVSLELDLRQRRQRLR